MVRQVEKMQTSGDQTAMRSILYSQMSEMKADAWGREAAGVCTHQWWPPSLVTDYRSLMLPQRPPQLVEMNHPSAFFCKPSITSDSSPQTPAPPPLAHLHRLAELHIRRGCRKTSCSRWVVLRNQPERTRRPPATLHPVPLPTFLFRPTLSRCSPAPHFFFFAFSSSSSALSPIFDVPVLHRPQSITTPGLCATAAYQSPRASPCPPSQSEQIIVDILKGPADEMAHCGGAICSAASVSQQTLSFVCCPGSWEDRSPHGDKQASHL